MYTASNEFISAMVRKPYIARITLDGIDTIQGEAVQEISFHGGANSSEEIMLLGSAFSGSAEITLDRSLFNCAIGKRELFIELGIDLSAGIEWIPMGRYTAGDPSENDGVLTVTAMDALGSKLDVDYEPLEGFDFSVADSVSSVKFLQTLCARRGVEVDTSNLTDIALNGSPEGFTERQIIGFISALYGGFANMDRQGILRIRCYEKTSIKVTADDYYEDGLEKATYTFTPGWLKCYNETSELTMIVGDLNAQQGIMLESIWMTQLILNSLWEKFKDFSYRPVKALSFFGNPLIDPGDIIAAEDITGVVSTIPVMTISHEYDGGLITDITASGQAVTNSYEGPTSRAVFRSAKKAQAYTDKETEKLNQLELLKRLTRDWVDDGIYLTKDGKIGINASAILVGILNAAIVKAGQMTSTNGSLVIDLDEGTFASVGSDGNLDKEKLQIGIAGLTLEHGYGRALLLRQTKQDDGSYIASLQFIDIPLADSAQQYGKYGATGFSVGGRPQYPAFMLSATRDSETDPGNVQITMPVYDHSQSLTLNGYWKHNGDGTYSMIGI